ncbi:hypothetical protein H072_9789 [Dactylellina haptotyla CBS 200.50]|uniref:Uncharacterized protein n=1 Tax=Dactylellina haptotyla (strain CBS 200.50) TaxID=1284197 RepID=S8A1S2_DACHA|nr:hypothetical protein H072_9789 [Dactylellina haptotyla CBS 200.50]
MAAQLKTSDFSVGWICALPIELAAALAVLDETYPQLEIPDGDKNIYKFGRIGTHNIVISCLPAGRYGITQAGIIATRMSSTFTKLRFGLMVGIGGGAPSKENDIRLGDIVVSQPTGGSGGVVQYDFGKAMENGEFVQTGSLNAPPSTLLAAVASIKALSPVELGRKISDTAQKIDEEDTRFFYPGQDTDKLFRATYYHVDSEGRHSNTCKFCDASKVLHREERPSDHPYIHYGIVASGNQVMKDGIKRDRIAAQTGALCFEMEAAGLMDFSCLVIRGICDYSDGHKNKRWQPYSALVAALYTKELLLQIPAVSKGETTNDDTLREYIKELNLVIPFHLPFPRNKFFVGRGEELLNAYKCFSQQDSTDIPLIFALTGTGGMGKTQIALEYAYRYHHEYTTVFWVYAASEETIRTSFIDIMQRIVREQARVTWPESSPKYQVIASKLGIPGLIDETGVVCADSKVIDRIRSALFHWLQLPHNRRWLMIFDNADDLESFKLAEYLPSQGGGAIFITSRRPEFSYSGLQVDLGGLDLESAVDLLFRLAHLTDATVSKTDTIALVEKLGFLPLAISHAGFYIHQTKMPPKEYMLHYDEAFTAVQSRKPSFGWNYRNDTAATTWEISFSRVEEQDKEAALLLLVCSYLNPQEIFETLWGENPFDGPKNKVMLLASYSLVRIVDFGVFSIHPVVHSWARERSGRSERLQVIKHALIILGEASRQKILTRESSEWEGLEERRLVSHLEQFSRYSWLLISGSVLQEAPKSECKILLDYIQNLAAIFDKQYKHDEAIKWYNRALAGRENILGKDHWSTLQTVHGVAGILNKYGKYDEAMQWYERALIGRENIFGKDHPSTLDTVNSIAIVLDNQGKPEAMQWYERALAGKEKALGEDHPSTLDVVYNIATYFEDRGKYDDAIQWYKRALAGEEKTLGKTHPSTMDTIEKIAYCSQRSAINVDLVEK